MSFSSSPKLTPWFSISFRFLVVYPPISPPRSGDATLPACYSQSNGGTASVAQGATAARAASAPLGLSIERLFCSRRTNGQVRPTGDRDEVAAGVGRRARLFDAEPGSHGPAGAEVLHAR